MMGNKLALVNPPIGNQPVFTAKSSSKTAKKNDGIAIPILVKTVNILSNGVRRLTAAIMPSGIPTNHVKSITIVVKSKVFGILWASFVLTFSPSEVTPKSPFTNDAAHLPY